MALGPLTDPEVLVAIFVILSAPELVTVRVTTVPVGEGWRTTLTVPGDESADFFLPSEIADALAWLARHAA